MIGWASWWTWTPSATPLLPKIWNAHFLIMFNFWWSAWLVNGLEPHPPPLSSQKNEILIFYYVQLLMLARLVNGLKPHPPLLSSQKNEMLVFRLRSLLMICLADWWTGTPSATPLQPKKWNAQFLDYVQLLMICQAGWWTRTPFATPLQPINEMLLFGLRSTSDDWLGYSMDSNPILHLSPAKEMKCSFLYYVQLLMISQACRWTWTPSTTCLQPRNEMLIFWLCSTSEDWPGWSMDSNPIHHPSPPQKMKCSFFITFNFWCWPDWSMESNPIHHPSPAKKMKCLFLDYIQLLMIGRAGWWTRTPSTTRLQPKKWNSHFFITLNFWWSARLVDGLKPHLPPLSCQQNEMLISGLRSLLMIGWASWWTWTPSATPFLPKKWNAHF